MIPAFPNTYVVCVNPQASDGYVKEPIVAWQEDPDNPMAHPIPLTMHGQRRILGEEGILFPCGMVSCALGDLSYGNVEEWLEAGPHTGRSQVDKGDKVPAAAKDVVKAAPASAEGVYDITWAKPFKSNSWWHYDDGEYEFLFQVDGGENTPKPTQKVVKVKRTEFMEMKKSLDVLTIDEIMNADPIDQPDEDDDDDDDLI